MGLLLLLAVAHGCGERTEAVRSEGCPTPDKPYLHPEECLDLIGMHRIVDLRISPFGGKVPVRITFVAEVEVAYPEMASGMTILWELDTEPGVDVETAPGEAVSRTYTECGNVLVRATAVDRFGRAAQPVERLLRNRCNKPPVIDLFAARNGGGPPVGDITSLIQFVIAAHDEDNEDPELEGANGIAQYAIDWEGDGVFDATLDGELAALGFRHTYDRVGIYRPVLRAYDAEGDYGESVPLTVSIFASTSFLRKVRLSGSPHDLAPFAYGSQRGWIVAWGSQGIGWLTQAADGVWVVAGNGQRADYDPPSVVERSQGAVAIDDTVLVANGGEGLVAWRLTDANGSFTPDRPRRYACGTPWSGTGASLDRIALARWGDPPRPRVAVLSATGRADVWVRDVQGLEGLAPNAVSPCLAVTDWGGGVLDRSATDFGPATFAAWTVTGPWFAAAASDGVRDAVLVYRLDRDTTPVCATTSTGCLWDVPAQALAMAVTESFAGPLAPRADGSWDLPRWAVTTAAATLWLGVPPVGFPQGSTAWSFLDERRIAVAPWAQTAAATATLEAHWQPLLALADAGELAVYTWSAADTQPVFTLRATATVGAADRLWLDRGWLIRFDRSSAYVASATDVMARQPRGAYLHPVTEPGRWVRLAPPRWLAVDAAGYEGPRRYRGVGRAAPWVVDADRVYAYAATSLWSALAGRVTAIAPATAGPVLTGTLPLDGLSGLAGGEVAVALGGAAALWRLSSDVPTLRWWRSDLTGIEHVALAPSGRLYVVGKERVRRYDSTGLPDAELVASGPVAALAVAADPAGGELLAVAYRGADGAIHVGLRRADTAGFVGSGPFGLLVPDDVAAAAGTILPEQTPVFARLAQAAERDRRLVVGGTTGADTFCLEPLWGRSCSGPAAEDAPFVVDALYQLWIGGQPYLLQYNAGAQAFSVLDQDLNVLTYEWHPCSDLPEAERLDCLTAFQIRGTAMADPYWILSTPYALFVVDFSDPAAPMVVTRQRQADVAYPWDGIAAWIEPQGIRVAARIQNGAALQLFDVPDLFTP